MIGTTISHYRIVEKIARGKGLVRARTAKM
jgi:hypothetical protein